MDVHEQAVERSADQGGVGTVRERAWVGGVSCCTARSGWRRPSRTGSFTRTWAAATPPGPSDLSGGDPARTVDPAEVLAGFLRALGSGAVRAPVVLPELAATFRTLLAGRRVLDVLDDAAGERQVRPLLPGTGHGSAVLIGSRTALPGLEETGLLCLDVLSASRTGELLARLTGQDRVAAEPDAAADIVRLCGGLPLAVRATSSRLGARHRWPLRVLADRMRDEATRLDELVCADLDVRAGLDGATARCRSRSAGSSGGSACWSAPTSPPGRPLRWLGRACPTRNASWTGSRTRICWSHWA
ncbi:hypothetical protein [Streptomyces griseorubiginosus]|uniref:hypothetical protein n=1 Tax=Streptomyces griseorubiginosus TaxID=67304 RepID=UPI0036EA6D8C